MDLKKEIREIENYPKKGISFKDITTLLNNPHAMDYAVNEIEMYFKLKKITKVVGLEARGFVLGGIIANRLGAGFVPARKAGKLPYEKFAETYDLEYGTDTVEMHKDALNKNDVVLIHDDLLATGGSANAVLNLVRKAGVQHICFSFLCDLEFIQTKHKERIRHFDHQVLIKYS